MRRARAGEILTLASALRAHRVCVARLAADPDEEPSEEAEAGALLEAWNMWDVRDTHRILEQVHRKE